MYDFDHNLLPKSFRKFVIKKNVTTDTRITRQFKLLVQEKPRTNFSSKLSRHNFTRMWNKVDEQIRNVNHRSKFKHMLRVFYLNTYQSQAYVPTLDVKNAIKLIFTIVFNFSFKSSPS